MTDGSHSPVDMVLRRARGGSSEGKRSSQEFAIEEEEERAQRKKSQNVSRGENEEVQIHFALEEAYIPKGN